MTTMNVQITTPNPIRCPICGRDIAPCAFVMVDTLMFCADCPHTYTYDALALEIHSAQLSCLSSLYAVSHGCIFYAPPPDTPRTLTAALIASSDPANCDPTHGYGIEHAGERIAPPVPPPYQGSNAVHPLSMIRKPSAADSSQIRLFDESDVPNAARVVPSEEG